MKKIALAAFDLHESADMRDMSLLTGRTKSTVSGPMFPSKASRIQECHLKTRSRQCGSTMIEAAIVIPLLFLFFAGMLEVASMLEARRSLSSTVDQAAREAASQTAFMEDGITCSDLLCASSGATCIRAGGSSSSTAPISSIERQAHLNVQQRLSTLIDLYRGQKQLPFVNRERFALDPCSYELSTKVEHHATGRRLLIELKGRYSPLISQFLGVTFTVRAYGPII